jgi:hypothetical protein
VTIAIGFVAALAAGTPHHPAHAQAESPRDATVEYLAEIDVAYLALCAARGSAQPHCAAAVDLLKAEFGLSGFAAHTAALAASPCHPAPLAEATIPGARRLLEQEAAEACFALRHGAWPPEVPAAPRLATGG